VVSEIFADGRGEPTEAFVEMRKEVLRIGDSLSFWTRSRCSSVEMKLYGHK